MKLSSGAAIAVGSPQIFAGCNNKSTTKPFDGDIIAKVSAIKGNNIYTLTKVS